MMAIETSVAAFVTCSVVVGVGRGTGRVRRRSHYVAAPARPSRSSQAHHHHDLYVNRRHRRLPVPRMSTDQHGRTA